MSKSVFIRVVITGEAGQGAIFAGIVLAEAAVSTGLYVTQSSVTGAAVRSGETECHVVIASEPMRYPYVDSPDVLIALSADAAIRRAESAVPGGYFLYDSDLLNAPPPCRAKTVPVPATKALRRAGLPPGNENLIFLGALSELETPISIRSLTAGLSRTLSAPSEVAATALLLGASLIGEGRKMS